MKKIIVILSLIFVSFICFAKSDILFYQGGIYVQSIVDEDGVQVQINGRDLGEGTTRIIKDNGNIDYFRIELQEYRDKFVEYNKIAKDNNVDKVSKEFKTDFERIYSDIWGWQLGSVTVKYVKDGDESYIEYKATENYGLNMWNGIVLKFTSVEMFDKFLEVLDYEKIKGNNDYKKYENLFN